MHVWQRLLKVIEGLDFGNFEDNQIDLFGDAYEYLISNYAAMLVSQAENFFHASKRIKIDSKTSDTWSNYN